MNKNPLSLLIFYRRNLMKLSPFLLISLFSVSLVICLVAFFDSWQDTAKFYNIALKKSATLFYDRESPTPLSLIKNNPSIQNIYPLKGAGEIPLKVLGGYINIIILGLNSKYLKPVMEYYDVRLKSGRLPKDNKNEIMVSEQIAKNKKWKLNSKIKLDEYDEVSYELVGILTGKTGIMFENCIYKNPKMDPQKIKKGYLITYKKGDQNYRNIAKSLENIEKVYEKTFKSYLYLDYWYEEREKPIKEVQKDINFMTNVSLVASIIVFCLISIFLNITYLQNRLGEFGLLLSLGLTKYQIIKKSFWENFWGIVISWFLGVLVANIFLNILYIFIFIPKGWFLNTLPVEALPLTIPIPLGMFICGFLVVFYKIQKLDPVEIIERRW